MLTRKIINTFETPTLPAPKQLRSAGQILRLKIFGGMAALFGLIGVLAAKNSHDQQVLIDISIATTYEATQDSFENIKTRDHRTLGVVLETFQQDDAFKLAFLSGDREKLYQLSFPLFQQLKSKYNITHFYFITLDDICFLRVHAKDLHGDKITRGW